MVGSGEEGRNGEGKRVKDGGEREDDTTPTEGEGHWWWLVELKQTAFWEGDLAEESTWQAVVLIQKGKGDYRGYLSIKIHYCNSQKFIP